MNKLRLITSNLIQDYCQTNTFTKYELIIPRKYTLTHSDFTEWKTNENSLYYNVYLFIDQREHDLTAATRRNEIFQH